MDLKMNSLALDLLGMRLTMKLPRPKLRKEEEAAEYKISIVRHDRSEVRPRARELPNNTRRAAGILTKNSLLKYDNRVVNQLLTVEQLQNIENWLGEQPDSFAKEEIEELENIEPVCLNQEKEDKRQDEDEDMVDKKQRNMVEVMDGFLEEVTKSTNFYRDIANNHNKQLFLKKKVVTLV